MLRLSLDDISNCSLLRKTVWTFQARLVQATRVGRSGNADLAVPDDWLPVIRFVPGSDNQQFLTKPTFALSISNVFFLLRFTA